MPIGPVTVPAAFILAFAAGLAAVWLALATLVTALFRGPDTALPLILLATPLLGLAIFQFLFTRLTGRWRGARFWFLATPATYATAALAMAPAALGWLPWPLAIALFVVILGGAGLACARTTRTGDAR